MPERRRRERRQGGPGDRRRSASAPAQQGGSRGCFCRRCGDTAAPAPHRPSASIVKSGSISLQVSDLTEGMRRVGEIVAGVPGAYVGASSTTYRGDVIVAAGWAVR